MEERNIKSISVGQGKLLIHTHIMGLRIHNLTTMATELHFSVCYPLCLGVYQTLMYNSMTLEGGLLLRSYFRVHSCIHEHEGSVSSIAQVAHLPHSECDALVPRCFNE